MAYGRAGQLQLTEGPHIIKDSPEAGRVYTYIETGGGVEVELTRRPFFTNNEIDKTHG